MSFDQNQSVLGRTEPPGLPVIRIRRARSSVTVVVLSLALGLSLVVNFVALSVIADLRSKALETEGQHGAGTSQAPGFLPVERENEDGEPKPEEVLSISDAYQGAIGSVVTIYCRNGSGTGFSFAIEPPAGMQSVVVTNHHVVKECLFGGDLVTLRQLSGRQSTGSVIGFDEANDLALIGTELELPPLYPSRGAQIGDQVLAIGSPGGPDGLPLEGSLTQGIISGIRAKVYQTDAAINPGNSGGPLIDLFGQVVGVNTAYWIEDSRIGFAVGVELLCERLMVCEGQ